MGEPAPSLSHQQQLQADRMIWVVLALHSEKQTEHVLNFFSSEPAAQAECHAWQVRHREWYKNGLNDFHIYVKQALLDHSGTGAMAMKECYKVSADWP